MNESFVVTAIKTFFPNSPLAMFYILLSLVAGWMYKQFRTYLINNQKSTTGKKWGNAEIGKRMKYKYF
ncbi:hypothetical protein EJP77_08685 [Paenibacillus zeisoli]|uniref:Uncharacterized protein n=1 Tax=Paenibacillus zeisoli TaxID=2496267 RepID=A0A3S1BUG7_9BACL|nr:hypothetical protein [Paenibacillus zeisoli]RUT33700.1 hypothetical protein EJP77_08685 [Paenibacillus zeisoli]